MQLESAFEDLRGDKALAFNEFKVLMAQLDAGDRRECLISPRQRRALEDKRIDARRKSVVNLTLGGEGATWWHN